MVATARIVADAQISHICQVMCTPHLMRGFFGTRKSPPTESRSVYLYGSLVDLGANVKCMHMRNYQSNWGTGSPTFKAMGPVCWSPKLSSVC